MEAKFLAEHFARGHMYEHYVHTGSAEQQRRWRDVYDAAKLSAAQRGLVAGFAREMKVLIVSGIWCGDCVHQCPLIQRIEEGNRARINLRFVDRDEHADLAKMVKINAGMRVPVAIFMAEDYEVCGVFGDRTLSRYRAPAVDRLGPACPTGILAPGEAEVAATMQEWLNEFERVQLMLRLSPRLRQKHGD